MKYEHLARAQTISIHPHMAQWKPAARNGGKQTHEWKLWDGKSTKHQNNSVTKKTTPMHFSVSPLGEVKRKIHIYNKWVAGVKLG